jgi:hypothetical protein
MKIANLNQVTGIVSNNYCPNSYLQQEDVTAILAMVQEVAAVFVKGAGDHFEDPAVCLHASPLVSAIGPASAIGYAPVDSNLVRIAGNSLCPTRDFPWQPPRHDQTHHPRP